MTALFPTTPYAEDQPYSHSILRFHVWLRGINMGAILALPTTALSTLWYGPRTLPTFTSRLVPHMFRGTVGGFIFGILAVESRMWGREEIEWKDRTWRIMRNLGQVEVDNWTLIGGALGAVLIGARRGPAGMSLARRATAGFGLGTAAGTVAYMGYRHGLHGSKWPKEKIAQS